MKKAKRGFTLLELLTVIAIIAILSAIIVPVYSRVKDNANRSNDQSNMNALRTALGLYREDQGAFPPALLGYVTLYASGPSAGGVVPANELRGFLFPRRVESLDTFRPYPVRFPATATTTAVFPPQDPTAVGTSPILDLNGDGAVSALDDTLGARQAFGPGDGPVCWNPQRQAIVAGALCSSVVTNDPADALARLFYQVSGYDVARVPTPGTGAPRWELRYSRFWSNFAIGSADPSFGAGNAADDPRQLGYTNPPDDTVVTWNSYYREYTSPGEPLAARRDIVLLLSGSARPADSRSLFLSSWRQRAN